MASTDSTTMTPGTETLRETGRAKVNLALHITGRRADRYHLLDTLVAFPDIADTVSARPAHGLSLDVTGPFAPALEAAGETKGNLVMRAALAMRERFAIPTGAALTLDKYLPIASGIGGGSADAAATLRLLARMWRIDGHDPRLGEIASALGADVAMCFASTPLRARGVGERITPLAALPSAGILLVNPGVAVATPQVFAALTRRDFPPLPDLPAFGDVAALSGYLRATRNDLQLPATTLVPAIATVIEALEGMEGVRLARMSGSGATCFALFDEQDAAQRAGAYLAERKRGRGWWIASASLA